MSDTKQDGKEYYILDHIRVSDVMIRHRRDLQKSGNYLLTDITDYSMPSTISLTDKDTNFLKTLFHYKGKR